MTGVEFHADDYGLSMNNAQRFIELMQAGRLDSISIIPNMSAYGPCMEQLKEAWSTFPKKPLFSVHLNIADGRSLAGLTDPMLVHAGAEGTFFHTSWGRLFLCSYLPGKRGRIRRALAREFAEQIRRVYEDLPEGARALRLDSHTHTHMIPVVFDAMLDAVRELGLADSLSFVRVSKEPLWPLRKAWSKVPPVNFIKNLLLNLLSGRTERKLDGLGVTHGLLWGVLTGGRMDAETVRLLLPAMRADAEAKGKQLEILFHPGIVLPEEGLPEEFTPGDRQAVCSADRDKEYEAVMGFCK
ncbi:MAG: ChbG/HpnK family deacetylase [Lachnospiraceae bacterium]|nr:ChbG/HpnK family deacetylase [Lachnospiraceae bacterium]